jgi:exodeoxyribonuclease VII large subunit
MKPDTNFDLFEQTTKESAAKHIFTVSEITDQISSVMEKKFACIYVEAEVSNIRLSTAGHIYLSLKDENAVLNGVIFSRAAHEVKFEIKNGLKVICFGSIEVYPPHGKYQLIIEGIEPKGIGSLQLALEQLKQRLEKEGLFDPAHKRQIPYLPSLIGVVTSLQGAAIKDIFKVLERRFKDVRIVINPVRVQGQGAKEEIACAINDFNLYNLEVPDGDKIEVIIVGRGGGSIEDLWAFNEEIVARAIYNSGIPVISAVGHERDWTIADLVADVRAPTPSVAAELVIPLKEDLRSSVEEAFNSLRNCFRGLLKEQGGCFEDACRRLNLCCQHIMELNTLNFNAAAKKLSFLNPALTINQNKAQILSLERQIQARMNHLMEFKRSLFLKEAQILSGLSPLNILLRGYSITFKLPQEEIIKDASSLKEGDIIKTMLNKGKILSKVTEVRGNG